jgi:probable O-glycosylation ligase (exosortase A-associated)
MNMPFVYASFVVTAFSMFMSKEPKRIPWTRETILLALFLLWMTLTTTQAFYSDLAWEQYNKVLKIQAGTFMTLMLINSKERIRIFIWVIALSLGYYGVKGGIFTIVHGGTYRVQGPASTFFEGNNEMGLALIMTVPLIRYLHLIETKGWVKLGLAGAMYLTTIAAFGTQSRGALVALAAMSGMLWLKSRNKFMTALLIGFSITAAVSFMPPEWFERMSTIKTYQQDDSALGRINAWWTAFNVAKSNITGGGFEMFRPAAFRQYAPDPNNVHDVHSIYFEVMGEHGFPGFFMFIGLMGFTWLKASTIIRACKRDSDKKWAADLAAMLQVSLVGYATGGAFLGLAYFDYLYHLIVLVVITWTLVFKPDFYLPKPDKVELINKISQPKALETGSHAQIKPIPIIR